MKSSSKLEKFVEDCFLPTRKIKSEPAKRYYVLAAHRLSDILGREAVIADLGQANLELYKSHLDSSGLKIESVNRYKSCLIRIWALAYQLGLVATKADRCDYRGLQFFRQLDCGGPAGKLLDDVVSSLADERSSNAIELLRWSVAQYSKLLGRPATVGDLNCELIEAFYETMEAANFPSAKIALLYVRSTWWAAHKAGLAESPPQQYSAPWDGLETIIHTAPPIVIDKLPESSKTLMLSDFLEKHYYPCQPGLSWKTKKEYRTSVNKLDRYLNRSAVLADLNNQTIGAYFSALIQLGQSESTVNKERNQLLAFWRFAHTMGMLIVGPLIQPLRPGEKVPTALTLDQLKALRRAIPELTGKTAGIPNASLMRACFSIQYVTGARLGEVLALRFDDISGRVLTFRAETRKFGKNPMVKSVPEWVINDIQMICKPKRSDVFPVENGVEKFAYLFDRLFRLAEVPRPKGKSSHLLRSTYATMIWVAGGNATDSLGHASEETTRKAYLDPRFKPDQSHEFLPDLGRGGDQNGGR